MRRQRLHLAGMIWKVSIQEVPVLDRLNMGIEAAIEFKRCFWRGQRETVQSEFVHDCLAPSALFPSRSLS